MDRGRTSGAGGSKGIVAGVKAALRPRSQSSVKAQPKSQINEEEGERNKQIGDAVMSTSKNYKSPKSPFAGWKRSRSKDKIKRDSTKTKDTKVEKRSNSNQSRPCSRSQAERLSSYVVEDYGSYSSDASEMLRDIQTGQYTSFQSRNDTTDRRVCANTEFERPAVNDHQVLTVGTAGKELEDPYSQNVDSCFADGTGSKDVNFPNTCFGLPCAGYLETSIDYFNDDQQNNFENMNGYGGIVNSSNYNADMEQAVDFNSTMNDTRNLYVAESFSEENNLDYHSAGTTNFSRYVSDKMQENMIVGDQNNYAVRVQGDGSEAQDIVSSEVKIEHDIHVGSTPVDSERQSWLKSALTYNLEVPEFPRNEVVVLALGIDQYIEEVFRYLDHSGEGKVHLEDFHALCNVLGLKDSQLDDKKSSTKRCHCIGSNLTLNGSADNSLLTSEASKEIGCPVHLTFSEFHDKLCESFIRGAKTETVVPLASRRSTNPKLVTSVVQVQRRYDVLDNISKCLDEVSAGLDADENKMIAECPAAGIVCCKCKQLAHQQQHIDRNSNIAVQPADSEYGFLQKQVLLQQQELQCLREVIEDMRVALQSSDAENLALQVKTLRSGGPSVGSSFHDLSLTDEEDTIDDLVKQLTALSRPVKTEHNEGTTIIPTNESTTLSKSCQTEIEGLNTSQDPLNTAFLSGDFSLEKELQATYEALQAAREEREATQADLQKVVCDLQERERDLRDAELSLKSAYTALEKVQYDNQALVMEIAETRSHLEETKTKLMETTENLQHARESILDKGRLLKEAHNKLNWIKNSRDSVVDCVCSARNLVAGSLDQVRAGEDALSSLVAISSLSLQHDSLNNSKTNRLDSYCRADSGLYSEESEREEDRRSPERSTGHNSASEDDLWLPSKSQENLKDINQESVTNDLNLSSSGPNYPPSSSAEYKNQINLMVTSSSVIITDLDEPTPCRAKRINGLGENSTAIIEGLERELKHLQKTLDEAEMEWKQERVCLPHETHKTKHENNLLDDELKEVEAERLRLAIIEDKLRQLLQVLLSVADLNLSRRTLGRLVLEAVEDAAGIRLGDIGFGVKDEEDDKVSPLTFLSNLLSSTTNYQALSTESLMQLAFEGLSFPPSIPGLLEPIEATLG